MDGRVSCNPSLTISTSTTYELAISTARDMDSIRQPVTYVTIRKLEIQDVSFYIS